MLHNNSCCRKIKFFTLIYFVSIFFIGTNTFADDPDPDSADDFIKIASGGFRQTVNGDSPNLEPNPLGSGHNSYSWSMGWFNGELYVGTVRDVVCFAGASGPLFDPCPPPGEPGANQKAEIWKYTPDVLLGVNGNWQRIYRSPLANSFVRFLSGNSQLPRDVGYRTMSVCNAGDGIERLYVATEGVPGNVLFSTNGSSFNPTSINGLRASVNSIINGSFDIGYRGLTCFKGRLYTSPTGEQSGATPDVSSNAILLSNDYPAQNGAWKTVVNFQTHPTLGDTDNQSAFDMVTVGDYLFVGVSNRTTGFELWKGDGTSCQPPPSACNIEWTKIIDSGGGRPADDIGPDVDNALATFGVHNGQLYVGAWESGFNEVGLAEMFRVAPDTDLWELLIGYPREDYEANPLFENFNCTDDVAETCYPSTGRGPGFGEIAVSPLTSIGNAHYFWRFASHGDHLYMGTFSLDYSPAGNLTAESGFEFYRTENGSAWDTISTTGLGNPFNYGIRSLLSVDGLGLVVGTANPFTNVPDIPGTEPFNGGTEVFLAVSIEPPPPEDTTAPVSTIDFPSDSGIFTEAQYLAGCDSPAVDDICGTSSDNESGVASVEVSIRDTDGKYWDGSSFGATTEVFLSATGTENWNFPFTPPESDDYKVHARGIDVAGNVEASPIVNFTYVKDTPPEDTTAPVSTIDFPSDSGIFTEAQYLAGCDSPAIDDICGTSSDSESGVASVEVSIRDTDGKYWDGSNFGATTEVFLSATGTENWNFPFTPPESDDYIVHARGIDVAGNAEGPVAATFTYEKNTNDPIVKISDLDAFRSGGFYPYFWQGTFTIFVVDEDNNPVADAVVHFDLEGSANTCTSNEAGQCVIHSGTFRFTSNATLEVTDIISDGATYDSELNSDPDNDSDGTMIILGR